MDIHHLRIFVSVFKNRSFSRAAEALLLTQPTVSDHIRALEEELGCRLFDRLTRKIIPTAEAELLYNQAVGIIEKTDGIKGVIGQLKKEIAGTLIIGASTIPGTYILPGIISSFRESNPSVSFDVRVSDTKGIIDMIAKHELLIGIVGSKLANTQIQYSNFLQDEMIVIAAPSFAARGTVSPIKLLEFPFVMREEGSGTRQEFEKIFDGRNIDMHNLRTAAVFGSTDAVKQAVMAGMGVSIVSRRAVETELKFKAVKEIKLKDVRMKRNFHIAVHKNRALSHPYRIFLEYLVAQKQQQSFSSR
ncbi:MAG: LysR family transcriptional regulator [Nitrospirae bacterium]|nr:MAG: LysR family transcriptional regulator [Nitrospirota bacterium]